MGRRHASSRASSLASIQFCWSLIPHLFLQCVNFAAAVVTTYLLLCARQRQRGQLFVSMAEFPTQRFNRALACSLDGHYCRLHPFGQPLLEQHWFPLEYTQEL